MRAALRSGRPFIALSAVALAIILLLALGLLGVVVAGGIGTFWPEPLEIFVLKDGTRVLGEIQKRESVAAGERFLLKVANRDLYGQDFRWLPASAISRREPADQALVLERREYGAFFGFLASTPEAAEETWRNFSAAVARSAHERAQLERRQNVLNRLNNGMAVLNRRLQRLSYQNLGASDEAAALRVEHGRLEQQHQAASREFEAALARERAHATLLRDGGGREKTLAHLDILRAYRPGRMSFLEKVTLYASRVRELLLDDPRESNTEGGLFPSICGTVLLVFLMSILSFPLGVMTGIYLREYARDGWLVRVVRIAVNNLAGIPSIVYGIFGLGFFIYGVGGALDRAFYPERMPEPTFGTGGLLWASLTLGLLTVPVVIVATEEALGVIPGGIRQASLALGATPFQTLCRVLLPMAAPGMLTGFILAMSRAAGEVAPLMVTGVVKLAPALPVDGEFPFLHAERKFMHLGFHIYDVGFQSPNVEAARPMVYITTLLLLMIVVLMTGGAIWLRARLRRAFSISAL